PLRGGASFSFRHRALRFIWIFIWQTFGCWTPTPFHPWRRLLLQLFGAKIHHKAKIYPNVKIWYPPNLKMAEYSCLGPNVNCYSMAKITLDSFVIVSQGAHLCSGSHDVDDPKFQLFAKPIHLHGHSWIAAEAFVGPGVTVHEGAVLGARGVAFKDLTAWTIYVGSPAKPLRPRAH
ncbi:MAG: putative colanic acid biosynthesis acetyltransferase, partial [Pedobacter sp.]